MRRCHLLAAILLVFASSSSARADMVLAGWNFAGVTGFGDSPMAPTTAHAFVKAGGLTRGGGVGTNNALNAANHGWGGTHWDTTSFDAASSANKIATFSLMPVKGNLLSLSSIDSYNVRRSGAGPTTGQWQYQIGDGGFFDLGSQITWGSDSVGGNIQTAINLSSISALQNVSETVTFRVVNWGASDFRGTWYFNSTSSSANDLVIQGTLTSVPEPGALLLVAAAGTVAIAGRRYRRRARPCGSGTSRIACTGHAGERWLRCD